jgi:hypothetical protein
MMGVAFSPGSIPGQVMWDLWWAKWHWGGSSPSSLAYPAGSHFTICSRFINDPIIRQSRR